MLSVPQTGREHNLDNKPTLIRYPHSLEIRYRYSPTSGKLMEVTADYDDETQVLAKDITFLPFGPLKTLTFGNELNRTLSYDQNYRLKGISTPGIQDLSYGFYTDSTIESILDQLTGGQPVF